MSFYTAILRPLLFQFDAERAHHFAILALKIGLYIKKSAPEDFVLRSNLWGIDFPSPIGMAAGFDKNAEIFEELFGLGFGFVETGTVTPLAQPGNDQPRMFRLTDDQGIINRLGFNNLGLENYTRNIKDWFDRGSLGIVGANLGKNKLSEDAIADYVTGVSTLSEYASYLVINVSSPNTPGLRDLQAKNDLLALLTATMNARGQSSRHPPLLLKIAPDISGEDIQDISDVAFETKIDGIIVSNTTVERPATLTSFNKVETGGLSGKPLFERSTKVLSEVYRVTEGKIPLIGVGGVSNGAQAYKKIKAGASLVQLYSAMTYCGPGLARIVAKELSALIKRDGYSNVVEAIGADHR